MPTKLKFRSGTTAELQNMVGQDGEIFIDTDKNVPVIQDGITPGGHPLISEEYLLENSLPPKTGIDKRYLNVQDGESVWKELSLLPAGSVVSVSRDMFLPESDFLKLDGSIKSKEEYPALASIFGDIPVAEVVSTETSNYYSFYSSSYQQRSNDENMVFDGTYYIRILAQDDPNYNTYTNYGNEDPYTDITVQFYPNSIVPGVTEYVDGTQFKIQRSLDGINWTTFTVAPFSNNAIRCKSISAGTDGIIYMLVDRPVGLDTINYAPLWDPLVEYTVNDDIQYRGYEYRLLASTSVIGVPPDESTDWQRRNITIQEQYSSILVKSEDHGSTWQEVSLGSMFNSRLLFQEQIKRVKYTKPRKVNPSDLIQWLPQTQYEIDDLIYHKDVIYRITSIIGSPTTPLTSTNAPVFRSGQGVNGDYQLTFEELYDRGSILLISDDSNGATPYLISIDAGESFKDLMDPQIQNYNYSYNIKIVDTSSGTYLYNILLNRAQGIQNNPNHRFYSITQDLLQTPNAVDPEYTYLPEVGLHYFKGGELNPINLPLSYNPSVNDAPFTSYRFTEPASCYNEETDQILYAHTTDSDTIILLSINSTDSVNAAFTAETSYNPSQPTLTSKFYSKITTSPDFDATKPYVNPEGDDYTTWKIAGVVKLHWSPIFGTMVFMKNKIYYSTDPASLQWKVISNIPSDKNNNFASCINTPDGVLVSCRDTVFYIKDGDSFGLPTIKDDVSLSYPTSYYVKI
jgi:hypothetical protein